MNPAQLLVRGWWWDDLHIEKATFLPFLPLLVFLSALVLLLYPLLVNKRKGRSGGGGHIRRYHRPIKTRVAAALLIQSSMGNRQRRTAFHPAVSLHFLLFIFEICWCGV